MSDLLQLLSRQLDGRSGAIGSQIGADPESTEKGIEMALPLLLGALANNAERPEGARSLAGAIDRDHGGDLLDSLGDLLGGGGSGGGGGMLGGLLGGLLGGGSGGGGLGSLVSGAQRSGERSSPLPKSLDGAGILGHILGGRRGAVERGISRGSGLSGQQVMQLLVMLAPLVMSALAKVKQQRRLDDTGLADVLRRERSSIESRTPQLGGRSFTDLLDQNDDGSIADDLARIGTALGGSLFGKR